MSKKGRKPPARSGTRTARLQPPQTTTKPSANEHPRRPIIPPGRGHLILMFAVITLGSAAVFAFFQQTPQAREIQYRVVAEYPHDETSFTQGLLYKDGILYESTGQYGESKIRKVELVSGKVLKSVDLDPDWFGEGLALVDNELFQLTWENNFGIVYDLELNELREFEYDGEGWGLTYDPSSKLLILSNGTSKLQFLDPKTFQVVRELIVRNGNLRLSQLNELEFIDGIIYANVWKSDVIYQISPVDGRIIGQLDLSELYPRRQRTVEDVLNGIALNPDTGNLLVTGKNWPKVYELRLGTGGR